MKMHLQIKDIMEYIEGYEKISIINKNEGVWAFDFIVIETNQKGKDPEIIWSVGRPKTEEAQTLTYDEIMEYEIVRIGTDLRYGDYCLCLYVDEEGKNEGNKGKGSVS